VSIFVTAAIAGRLTSFVPTRWLIGARLRADRDRAPADARTVTCVRVDHLLPGMIVGGAGSGLVNVPLVATAVGVVAAAPGPGWPQASTRPSDRSAFADGVSQCSGTIVCA